MGSWLTSEDHVLCKVLDPGGARGVGRGRRRPLLFDLRMWVECIIMEQNVQRMQRMQS